MNPRVHASTGRVPQVWDCAACDHPNGTFVEGEHRCVECGRLNRVSFDADCEGDPPQMVANNAAVLVEDAAPVAYRGAARVYLVETPGEAWWVVAARTAAAVAALEDVDDDVDPPEKIRELDAGDVIDILFDPSFGVDAATPHGIPAGATVEEEEGRVFATAAAWAALFEPHAPTVLAAERWAP